MSTMNSPSNLLFQLKNGHNGTPVTSKIRMYDAPKYDDKPPTVHDVPHMSTIMAAAASNAQSPTVQPNSSAADDDAPIALRSPLIAVNYGTATTPKYVTPARNVFPSGDDHQQSQNGKAMGKHDALSSPEQHLADSEEKFIWVLDPLTRKLRVPVADIVPTQATATSGTVPSLCIAFLEGRCRHPWCRQAHVQPSAIPKLRADALNAPTCCFFHKNPHKVDILTSRFKTITVSDSNLSEQIPTERVALTVGLQRYMAHSVPAETKGPNLDLPSKLICRLHLAHRCRYLEDCNNVHICREYELKLQPPPHILQPLSSVTPSSRTVTVGDTLYTVTVLATGDVSDAKFADLCEQQKHMAPPSWRESISLNTSRTSPLLTSYGCSFHNTPVLGGTFPSIPFSQIPTSTAIMESYASGRSPLTLAAQQTTPLSFHQTPAADFYLQPPPQSPGSQLGSTRPLRVYDVRQRANGDNLMSPQILNTKTLPAGKHAKCDSCSESSTPAANTESPTPTRNTSPTKVSP